MAARSVLLSFVGLEPFSTPFPVLSDVMCDLTFVIIISLSVFKCFWIEEESIGNKMNICRRSVELYFFSKGVRQGTE